MSVEFSSFPPSYRHPAVPEGLQYYTLSAQLSELQLVFLYRFLQENLNYLTTMLAMRLPALDAGSGGGGGAGDAPAVVAAAAAIPPTSPSKAAPEGQHGGGSTAAAPAQEALQPFVLLLDVQADAPNICLPRGSGAAGSCVLGMQQRAPSENLRFAIAVVLLPKSRLLACLLTLPVSCCRQHGCH